MARQHRLLFPRRPGRPRKDPADRRGHHARCAVDPRQPLLLTLKFAPGVPHARTYEAHAVFEDVLRDKIHPERLRVVEYTLQGDHYHLIVEAPEGRPGLARALQGLHGSLTRRWNRLWRRSGALVGDYDERVLDNDVRAANAVRYVLFNACHHEVWGVDPDPASSARWSSAWSRPLAPRDRTPFPSPLFLPGTRILREAYRCFPPVPGVESRPARRRA